MRSILGLPFVALACVACTEHMAGPPAEPPGPERVASTRGSAIVLSRDETVAVAANRTAGVITVLRLDPTQTPDALLLDDRQIELDVGDGSEPWAAVIGADDDTAYVILRGRGTIQRVTNLHGTPKLDGTVAVGADPTGIAISPSGQVVFVANWGDGTLGVLNTTISPLKVFRFDMNQPLLDAADLGDISGRPGLAHPRALAVTDSGTWQGDDDGVFLTEFFSQPLSGVDDDPPDHLAVDKNRKGLVYSFPVSGANVETPTYEFAPVSDTTFVDSEMRMTACFPNQLYAAATDSRFLFVTGMCSSPRGPVGTKPNVQTLFHPTIFVTNVTTGTELAPVVLTQRLRDAYMVDGGTGPARMPLIPNDIALTKNPSGDGSLSAYVTAFGADAVFRVDFDANGAFRDVGRAGARFIDLKDPRGGGLLPIGITLSQTATHPFALVVNDNSQNVTVIDRQTDGVVDVRDATPKTPRAADVRDSDANSGRRSFATGLSVWSQDGQAWSSCESCHPDGLSDGLTWFFSRGPRRTISTSSTYDHGAQERRRILLWGANADEIHDVEGIARSVDGGAGGILWNYQGTADCRLVYDGKGCATTSPPGGCTLTGSGMGACDAPKHTTYLLNGLNGSLAEAVPEMGSACELDAMTCDSSALQDWNHIDAFIRSVRTPKSPGRSGAIGELQNKDVDDGAILFRDGKCAGCHGGPAWTISKMFYEPGLATNGALPYVAPETGILDLIGTLRTTTYEPGSGFPAALNPPSQNGPATLRSWAPADGTDLSLRTYAYDTGLANDQLSCALRAVGTFPVQPMPAVPDQPNTTGIVAPGAPFVLELRQDMKTLAFGATGFNVPSLLGLATRAPFFHAGNARTLEEVFDPAFRAHYEALAPGFLPDSSERANQVRALVAFLLSIDADTPPSDVPTDLGFDPVLCVPPG